MAKKKTPGDGEESAGPSASAGHDASRPYVVLARKYRPASFDDLIGQDAMVTTLRNAFAAGRIAQGFMLTGVRGVGKTTTARILARALNYETDTVDKPTIDMPVPGRHCAEIMEGRHPDVFEMDAASNTGVDNIREIIESAQYTPIIARAKVFIIDEVHMLSKGAFNALLKTLEEPPPHVKFIFATTEIRKVPVTVLSRCQRFDLRRVEQPVLVKHFKSISAKEGAQADDDALALIARAAEGSVRDGLSLLDRAIAMAGGDASAGHVTAKMVRDMIGLADRARVFDLAESIFKGDTAAALKQMESLHHDGAEPVQIVSDLAEAIHTIARIKAVGEEPAGEGLSVEEKSRGTSLAARLSMPYLSRAWQMLLKGLEETGRAPNPVAAAEMLLIRLACTADLPTPDELIRTLGGGSVSRGAPMSSQTSVRNAEIRDERGPLNAAGQPATASQFVPQAADNDEEDFFGEAAPQPVTFDDGEDGDGDLFDGAESDGEAAPAVPVFPDPRSFADVIALAGVKRDARLKIALEDHVSLVKFDAKAGSIDLYLLPGAAEALANDLREKLNLWTGRRWVIVLSKVEGEPAVGAVRREKEAREIEALKAHPAVRALLDAFPEAKIADVRKIIGTAAPDDESAAG